MMQQAEEKKRGVRETIEEMREEYRALLDRNQALPAHIRLFKKVSMPTVTGQLGSVTLSLPAQKLPLSQILPTID